MFCSQSLVQDTLDRIGKHKVGLYLLYYVAACHAHASQVGVVVVLLHRWCCLSLSLPPLTQGVLGCIIAGNDGSIHKATLDVSA
jgi:hypothetical protein